MNWRNYWTHRLRSRSGYFETLIPFPKKAQKDGTPCLAGRQALLSKEGLGVVQIQLAPLDGPIPIVAWSSEYQLLKIDQKNRHDEIQDRCHPR